MKIPSYPGLNTAAVPGYEKPRAVATRAISRWSATSSAGLAREGRVEILAGLATWSADGKSSPVERGGRGDFFRDPSADLQDSSMIESA